MHLQFTSHRSVPCALEMLQTESEKLWILTVTTDQVADLIIMLTALQYEKIPQVAFSDKSSRAAIRKDGKNAYSLHMDRTSLPVSHVWLETLVSMLLEVHLNGWSVTSHLDQDFPTAWGNVCVCVRVTPPMQ